MVAKQFSESGHAAGESAGAGAGAAVGILMLQTRFPRIPGDIGNPVTWPFPVHYKVVQGATPERVVLHKSAGLVGVFTRAARELVEEGAAAITTSCGFLSLLQEELQAAAKVPVAASALMQVPVINAALPPQKCCAILTVHKAALTEEHLHCAGVPADTPIAGTEDAAEFTRAIVGDRAHFNVDRARAEIVTAAQTLTNHPRAGAIVLECTNMIPYARAVQAATGLPVFSMFNLVQWLYAAVRPPAF
ncbi:MAG: aspartate/glutamate racemase family protein [Gammaproteobacteria bacterium]|nr:aspartate/glutamate racemase family protein [Gammaproteobacteria bacterium]MDD9798910.1 aspartate/glutamate racemase family protein [Gammaproteobacteria bacterium]MDD9851607.1 aspartate/glutamate racemase family protein [Gammaproteobacteria bacterium]MDD9871571.1 aspartate/glutamate racemase family protein [Gammaproteobacteria bacterium]